MAESVWTTIPKDAFNCVWNFTASYFAAIKEIFDNSIASVFGDEAFDQWQSNWIPNISHVLTNASGLFQFQSITHPDLYQFLFILVTALFSLFGLYIAFGIVLLAVKFLRWLIFGHRGRIECRIDSNESFSEAPQSPSRPTTGDANGESRRWFKQAKNDLESARNDFEGEIPAPEWVCYKCYQAVEKLLKAFIIARNIPMHGKVRDVVELASLTRDTQLRNIVNQMQRMIGSVSQMHHLDSVPSPHVPRDVYSLQVAAAVHELAEGAVEYTGHLLGIE